MCAVHRLLYPQILLSSTTFLHDDAQERCHSTVTWMWQQMSWEEGPCDCMCWYQYGMVHMGLTVPAQTSF